MKPRSLLFAISLLGAGALVHAVFATDGDEVSVSLTELRNFSEVFSLIRRQYVDEVDDRTLIRNAMRGMASELDPYTTYLDQEDLKSWEVSTSGEFGGLGIVVNKDKKDSAIRIISPIDDTPAQRAGVQSGDLVIELDGKTVHDMTLHDAVQTMRGEPGTDITLTLLREGLDEPFKITITRAIIKIESVRSAMLEPGYAYLRISNFQARTGPSFIRHLNEMRDQNDDGLKGLILDLRNNPGGLLSTAIEISDVFLKHHQLIVSTRGRAQQSSGEERATGDDLVADVPVVVLINGGSASASEIVAGALQDHGRAQLLGTKTFGKGSVQTVLPLNNQDAAIKLTTARYYTPMGNSIHEKGIEPDHIVEFIPPDEEDAGKDATPDLNEVVRDNQIEAALELLMRHKTHTANALESVL